MAKTPEKESYKVTTYNNSNYVKVEMVITGGKLITIINALINHNTILAKELYHSINEAYNNENE